MDIFYIDFLDCLESMHGKIKWLVASLPQPALDWSLQPGVGSLCMLVSHIAGAERYWVGEVVGREQPIRRPGSLYRVTGLSSRELCQRLDNSLNSCRKVLEEYQAADLEDKRLSPRDGGEVTVRWSLMHVMSHTIDHQRDIIAMRHLCTKRLYSQTHQTLMREIVVA
jgi:uncharacterized damage-inducible protein DinB